MLRLEYENHTLFMTKMAEISKNRYPIDDQNVWKPIPFGAAHIYIAYKKEKSPSPRVWQVCSEWPKKSNLHNGRHQRSGGDNMKKE